MHLFSKWHFNNVSILECLNLKKEEVLVSNYTMVATANVVKFTNLRLKLVDISDKDLCMCPKDFEKEDNKKNQSCNLYSNEW